MFLSTKTDKKGFWYLLDVAENCRFIFSYVVIGTGGRQGSGEIRGSSSNSKEWKYVEIDFPVLHIGITDLKVDAEPSDRTVVQKPYSSDTSAERLPSDGLSRRKAIRTIATTLLSGGALFMLPSALSSGQVLGAEIGSESQHSGKSAEEYSPYDITSDHYSYY